MTVNLAAIAARARGTLAGAFTTSGTVVSVYPPADDEDLTVDLAALTATEPTVPAIATGILAIIRPDGVDTQPEGPERVSAPGRYVVIVPAADVTDVGQGYRVRIDVCPDPRLAGVTLTVTGVVDDGLNVVRQIQARRP